MAASYNTGPDQTWFADYGATNHITKDLKNLSLQSDYQGTDKVSIGNGQGLPISKLGSSIISTPTSIFRLKNVLQVPDIATNLLSVHQFTKDNNCIFVFDASGFRI